MFGERGGRHSLLSPLSINVLLFAITQVARLGQREEKKKKKKKKKRRRKEARNDKETAPSVEPRHRPSSPKVIYFVWWPRACAAIQTWQFLPGLI